MRTDPSWARAWPPPPSATAPPSAAPGLRMRVWVGVGACVWVGGGGCRAWRVCGRAPCMSTPPMPPPPPPDHLQGAHTWRLGVDRVKVVLWKDVGLEDTVSKCPACMQRGAGGRGGKEARAARMRPWRAERPLPPAPPLPPPPRHPRAYSLLEPRLDGGLQRHVVGPPQGQIKVHQGLLNERDLRVVCVCVGGGGRWVLGGGRRTMNQLSAAPRRSCMLTCTAPTTGSRPSRGRSVRRRRPRSAASSTPTVKVSRSIRGFSIKSGSHACGKGAGGAWKRRAGASRGQLGAHRRANA